MDTWIYILIIALAKYWNIIYWPLIYLANISIIINYNVIVRENAESGYKIGMIIDRVLNTWNMVHVMKQSYETLHVSDSWNQNLFLGRKTVINSSRHLDMVRYVWDWDTLSYEKI